MNSIGQNSASEFFENILYATAYPEAQNQIKDFTKDIDSTVIKEALASSITILTSGLIFMMIQKQENLINAVFLKASGLVAIILGSSIATKAKQRLQGKLKGVKLFKKLGLFQTSKSDDINLSKVVVEGATSIVTANGSTTNSVQMYNTGIAEKEHLVNREQLHHSVGNSMASRYNETLMFKLFTKSFTSADEQIIRKVLGRDTATIVNVEDMNKIADFMFVKDSLGNVTGLSEQMFQLINGLGFVHKPTSGL